MAITVPISAACSSVPACNLVSNGWNSASQFADGAYADTTYYLSQLFGAIDVAGLDDVPTADLQVDFPTANIPELNIGAAPSVPDGLTINIPTEPNAPSLESLATLGVPDAPQFLADFPTISIPAQPSPFVANEPGDAPGITLPGAPDTPTLTIPDVPTLRELNLPAVPAITLPTFDETAPTNDLIAPSVDINWSEASYDSTMLQKHNDVVLDQLNNGYGGLPDHIVDRLWDRERRRETVVANREKQSAIAEFASRGFQLPPGALQERLQEVEENIADRDSTLGRERVIEEATRAYQNFQFVLQQALAQETQLLNHANNVAQRALQAQIASVDATVNVFNAKVSLYNAEVQAYSVFAQVFQARIQAELSKIEVYRAQLEGVKAIGQLNLQDLEAYKTSIDAVQSIAEVYRTEVQAYTAQAELQRIGLDAYKAEVDAYTARVQAKAVEYEGYAQGINAELSKVRIYETQANAYNSEVNGYRALVDAEVAKTRNATDINQARIAQYQGLLDAFRAKIGAEATRVGALVQGYSAEVQAYTATIGGETAQVEAAVRTYDAEVRAAAAEADIQLKEAEVNIERAQALLNLHNNALQAGATVSSQLTASALNMVNLSAGISGSDSTVTNL